MRNYKNRARFFPLPFLFLTLLIVMCAGDRAWSQATVPRDSGSQRTLSKPGSSPTNEQKFKAIFEPVNYNQDLKLNDAFFISAEEGWVSGAAGTILHTTDGGKTWTAQLGGDPQAQGPDITRLFFLDKTTGWAQGRLGQLFRTSDGKNWQQVHSDVRGQNVVFITPQHGFYAYGGDILETQDGGSTWRKVYQCASQAIVQGLTKQIRCGVDDLHFPLPTVGYGVGTSTAPGGGVVVKSEDGGSTWQVIFMPPESGDQRTNVVHFLDADHGFALRNTGMFRTSDGGRSWQGVPTSIGSNHEPLKFADAEVGWGLAQVPATSTARLTYTTDGGAHWLAHDLKFPAELHGFGIPRRDTAYVVGEHGMVYRYRIVPFDYKVANMIVAPAMPVSDTAER